jgi:hypothetical protein
MPMTKAIWMGWPLVAGVQRGDGSVVRKLVLNDEYSQAIDARQAHRLARELIAAADELDLLSDADWRQSGMSDPDGKIQP